MARNRRDPNVETNGASGGTDQGPALVALAYDPIFVWDVEHGIQEWNAGAERLYGFSAAEAKGRMSHILLKTVFPLPFNKYLKRLKTDGFWSGELRHLTSDGRAVVVESRQQIVDANGRRLVLESNRDISMRRAEENRIALLAVIGEIIRTITDPEALLYAVSKAVGEYFDVRRCLFNEIDLYHDLETVHRDYCRGAESVAGQHRISEYSEITSAEMTRGRTVVNTDSRTDPRTAKLYKRVYGPSRERAYVTVPLMRDDTWVASLWLSTDEPRIWDENEVALLEIIAERAWLAVEKLRNESALRESRERFARAFNSSPLAITITSLPTGLLVDVNNTFVELTGYSRDEAVGRSTADLGLWKYPADREAELAQAVREGKIRNSEYHFRMRDGTEIIGLLSAELLELGGEQCVLTVIQDITERKRAEEEIRAGKAEIELILTGTPFMLTHCSRDLRYIYASRSYAEMLGRSPEELVDVRIVDIMGEEGLAKIMPRIEAVLAGEKVEYEDDIPFERIGVRHLHVSYRPERDQDGTVTGWISSIVDITERRQSEIIGARYRLLSEQSNDIIWFVRPDGSFVDVNRAAIEAYGYTREEFSRLTLTDIRHPSTRGQIADQFRAADEASIHFETIHIRKDGTAFPVEVTASGADFGGERLVMAIVRDISERKLAEEALRKSEELFSRFMHHLPGLAWIKDTSGRYVYANEAAETTFGTKLASLYGNTDKSLFPPEVAAQFRKNDENALKEPAGLQTVETLAHDDGVLHHSIVNKFPISDPDGQVRLIGGMAIDITDRMQAAAALRESEERRELAERAGNVGIWDWSIEAGRTYWSETMWSIYGEKAEGRDPDEKLWSSHLHPNDRQRAVANIHRAVDSLEDDYSDEFRIVRSDGSIRWIEARGTIERTETGVPLRMYGVDLDISARKEAEERVRLSENQLRLITNSVPALISYVDSNERYRFANEKFTEWFGIPTDEIVGKRVSDLFSIDAYRAIKPLVRKALSGEKVSEERLLHYDLVGSRYVHLSYIPDIGIDGTVYGYYGLTHDQTDLKRSEDLLRSSEERIGLLMESFTDYAIFSVDDTGRIDSWNKGARNIFGYTQDEILGRPYEVIFEPDDLTRGVPAKEMKIARQKGRAFDERWHLKKDGTRFFASGVMMPLFVGKTLTGYAKIASDLTEKKRHAEELQRAHDLLEVRVNERTIELAESNRALVREMEEREVAEHERIDLLRRLVNSQEFERRRIARDLHDQLGQRLTALRLKIQSLKEISAENREFATRVERLQEIAERLDSEVSFLAWELRPTALDDLGLADAIGAFVHEWSRHYETVAEFQSFGLTKERLNHDTETHLYRISQEALNNIAKHAAAKSVTVLLEQRGDDLILIIEDDGKGFDPDGDRVSSDSASGLGLVGMRERAVLVGGGVEIESAPGKGTTIFVRVPVLV